MPKSRNPSEGQHAGNGGDCFQSGKPGISPLKEGATIHHLKAVRCALPRAPCREQMISADFQSAPIITGEATLPLRWLPPATPLWTCRPGTPCFASCSRPASYMLACAVSSEADKKMIYSKKKLKLPIDPHGAS